MANFTPCGVLSCGHIQSMLPCFLLAKPEFCSLPFAKTSSTMPGFFLRTFHDRCRRFGSHSFERFFFLCINLSLSRRFAKTSSRMPGISLRTFHDRSGAFALDKAMFALMSGPQTETTLCVCRSHGGMFTAGPVGSLRTLALF